MKTIRKKIAFLAAAAVAAVSLTHAASADTIRMGGGKPAVEGNVVADSLKGVFWQSRVGGAMKSASGKIWEVETYKLSRNITGGDKFEEAWNKANNIGVNKSWLRAVDEIKKALDSKVPAGYPDPEGMRLRLLYYKVRALAEAATDEAAVTAAYNEYVDANKKEAETLKKSSNDLLRSGKFVTKGAYKGIDPGLLHSYSIDAAAAVALFYRKSSKPTDAWEKGYSVAADLAQDAFNAFTQNPYVSSYAVPLLKSATEMFLSGIAPDWASAGPAFQRIQDLAAAARDDSTSKWAKMRLARCNLNTGKEADAERVYKEGIEPYEQSRISGGPGTSGWKWLTPDLASVYAEAANGLGLIALAHKDNFAALKQFSLSVSFFSANREARAEALYWAATVSVRLAKANPASKSDCYQKAAEAYRDELKLSLTDTEYGRKVDEVDRLIAEIAK
jgi:hypothetical protein